MMNAYWTNLNKREQILVIFGAIALFALFFYSALYQPLHRKVQQQQRLMEEKRETLLWMERLHVPSTAAKPTKTVSNQQLLSAITEELKAQSFKKYAYQAQQSSNGDIQFSFENVPYLPFIHWLWRFQNQYRMEIKQCVIERTPTAGVVKLTLIVNALK